MNRNISLDILKLIMAFMVVGIHSGFLDDISAVGRYITVNGLFRIAVPVFLVINGFFFYSSLESQTVAKWFKRILVLYAFWTLVYIYFWFPSEISAFGIAKIIKTILVGHNHLWYLPAMIGAAAVLYFVRNLSSALLFSASIALFAAGAAMQYAGNYHLFSNPTLDKVVNTLWLYRNFLFFAFPFFCIGYLFKRTGYYKKIQRGHAIIAALIGIGLLMGESYLDFSAQENAQGFDIFASLIFACPFIFLVALSSQVQGSSKSLALYSTAIYFVHPLFIYAIDAYVTMGGTAKAFAVGIASTIAAAIIIKLNTRVKIML